MATKTKAHKKLTKKCSKCGKRHSVSEHLSHGKGSFNSFPSRKPTPKKGKGSKAKTKTNQTLTKAEFLRRMNKGRKAKGLPPIKAKR
jgi:uncharacterized protein YkwD